MKNILLHQNFFSVGESVCLIDGQKIEDSNKKMQAINRMRKAQCGRPLKADKRYSNELPSITCTIYTNGFNSLLVKSHFISKDESDRRIVYHFFTEDISNATKTLQSYCAQLGMKLHPKDCEVINKLITKQRKKTIFAILLLFITLLIILLFLTF